MANCSPGQSSDSTRRNRGSPLLPWPITLPFQWTWAQGRSDRIHGVITEGMRLAGQLWVELSGDLILARVRGEPTAELLRECQERVLSLVKSVGKGRVLYDTLEMKAPPVDVPLIQQELDQEMDGTTLKRAIVVPNTRLAYLARLAFGEDDYRVFYDDVAAAVKWLSDAPGES